ncbi:hypothetical protein MLD38_034408 [Melastoma candidum]|uniref:Uncharacterized protein n=1 Tax=Melastoma candidum TaxID=119954 RepID=A0ACB9MBP0_9MYRT|nr:hypothetical protein MLD38_034408 [Melastoma candidum]
MEQAADTRRPQLPFRNGSPISFAQSGVGPTAASQTLDSHNSVHLLPGVLQSRETLSVCTSEPEIDKDANPDPLSFAFSPGSLAPPPPPPSGAFRYRECLRNHAASVGGNVTDGCCEFMPSGDDGTQESLKCAACKCHRNFHRKDFEDSHGSRGLTPRLLLPPPRARYTVVSPTPVNMAYGGTDQSSSEDIDGTTVGMARPEYAAGSAAVRGFTTKKRNRTKFTREQKEKMWEFAERLGWRMQRPNDEDVDGFCTSIGVRRQVFKVWMHNNKNSNSNAKVISYDLAARIQQLPGSDLELGQVVGHNAGAGPAGDEHAVPSSE